VEKVDQLDRDRRLVPGRGGGQPEPFVGQPVSLAQASGVGQGGTQRVQRTQHERDIPGAPRSGHRGPRQLQIRVEGCPARHPRPRHREYRGGPLIAGSARTAASASSATTRSRGTGSVKDIENRVAASTAEATATACAVRAPAAAARAAACSNNLKPVSPSEIVSATDAAVPRSSAAAIGSGASSAAVR
jgi:hypothetical protein